MAIKPKDMAKMIDHTILNSTASVKDVKEKCEEAKEYNFAAVCVNPCFVPMTAKLLLDTSVKVSTVVGFPLGADTSESKAYETKDAIRNGAQEIDMVANIGAIKSKNWNYLREDIKAVVDATKIAGVTKDIITKVVIETAYLTEDEIKKVSRLAKKAGIDFIKTSTGLVEVGTTEQVSLIRKVVGRSIGVEAYGEIRNFSDGLDMLDAGANRIGTSYGVEVITDEKE